MWPFEYDQASANTMLKFKKMSEHYVPLLVEDIISDHPAEVHYGKCSVIGRIKFNETDKLYYLESVRICGLPSHLQIPDGYFRIRLLTGLLRGNMYLNHTVEVLGEVVLWNHEAPAHHPENMLLKTSQDLCLELREIYDKTREENRLDQHFEGDPKDMCSEIQNEFREQLEEMKNKYKIVLRAFQIMPTSYASNLVSLNLQLKYIRDAKIK